MAGFVLASSGYRAQTDIIARPCAQRLGQPRRFDDRQLMRPVRTAREGEGI
jgi:hypothetical protein